MQGHLDVTQYGQIMDPATGRPGDAFIASSDGAWCEISAVPDDDGKRTVWQAGPRLLWDYIEAAHGRWTQLGRPGWERFGLTVTERLHCVWLDSPDTSNQWPITSQQNRPK